VGLRWPPVHCIPGVLLPEIKRPGREDDHSPPHRADFKNEWSYISTPNVCPHGMHRDNVFMIFTLNVTVERVALLLRKWEV
jgi:hypothetical protein